MDEVARRTEIPEQLYFRSSAVSIVLLNAEIICKVCTRQSGFASLALGTNLHVLALDCRSFPLHFYNNLGYSPVEVEGESFDRKN
jgi:hypothetical protein